MARRRAGGRREAPPPLPTPRRIETGPDGYEYEVRTVAAARAAKAYRCPGCDHEIKPGTTHLVVWQIDLGESAMDDRRHWHTSCWSHRATRSPTRKWS